MNTSRSPIDSVLKSRDPFALGYMALGQERTEGKSGLMVWLRASESSITSSPSQPRLLVERIGLFPSSGEIRCAACNPLGVLAYLKNSYADAALDVDEGNGLRLTFTEWRFNICLLETEPAILLHVESRGDIALMQQKTAELLARIREKSSSDF
ncbi:hypothetical protein [Pseudomonas izuensis]|uniref:Mannose-1-phosphate guanylyltransferase n=1 Tax=Pseudomonas izuensis TaxID=2684212 RepID=A0ABM7RPE4_9PSED|nr:hypothetical protein [Pseudomonas izuensis]BCX67096.1 mannose-1-phosphate guanylyltransferase [Pseudomonas izuensis]